jgi:hypothetical protein
MDKVRTRRLVATAGLAVTSPASAVGLVVLGWVVAIPFWDVTVSAAESVGVARPGPFLPVGAGVAVIGVAFVMLVRWTRAAGPVGSRVLAAVTGLLAGGIAALGAYVGSVIALVVVGAIPFLETGEPTPWAMPLVLATAAAAGLVTAIYAVLLLRGRARRASRPTWTGV